MVTLKGNIGVVGFEYELTNEKEHKEAIKDLKELSKRINVNVKKDNPLHKKMRGYEKKIEDLKKVTKELEKQLKHTNALSFMEGFARLIRMEIHKYKDWDIQKVVTNEILNDKRYGGQLRKLIQKIADEIFEDKFTGNEKKVLEGL